MMTKDQQVLIGQAGGVGLLSAAVYLWFGAAAGLATAGIFILLLAEDARDD